MSLLMIICINKYISHRERKKMFHFITNKLITDFTHFQAFLFSHNIYNNNDAE